MIYLAAVIAAVIVLIGVAFMVSPLLNAIAEAVVQLEQDNKMLLYEVDQLRSVLERRHHPVPRARQEA